MNAFIASSLRSEFVTDLQDRRAIETDFPFAELGEIAEAESWRKEIYRPIYHLHKWWAKRLGSVFRAIILASVYPEGAPILERFYDAHDLTGLVVFDPFMGSGTTVGEALKLGCTAIGRDINPVAYHTVKAAFAKVTEKEVRDAYAVLESSVGNRIRELYRLSDGSEVLYHFWVMRVTCPDCGFDIDLFNRYVFSRHAYPSRNPEAKCLCPECNEVFSCRYDSKCETCPRCHRRFDPQVGTVTGRGAKVTCPSCRGTHPVLRAVKSYEGPPAYRMYAKLVLTPEGEKEYRRITDEDLANFERARQLMMREEPLILSSEIAPGHNTNQAMNYGFTRWDQFFNPRQLLALTWLGKAIRNIGDPDLRLVFGVLFSGILEFNNMFCSFKSEGSGAVRHMFSHHILKPERQPLEANVWGTPKSSGAFSTLFESRLIRALKYRRAPFELALEQGKTRKRASSKTLEDVRIVSRASDLTPGAAYLSCGDSSQTDIPERSVDLVITDPPFFDNVHYSELADFFHVWQVPVIGSPIREPTTRAPEEVQDVDETHFSDKLAAVFKECHRVLKDDGLLVFTYHHSREEGWSAVARAVKSAGFSFVAAWPIKSEMSIAVPKHQAKEPIDFDVAFICRKAETLSEIPKDMDQAFEDALTEAETRISRLLSVGRKNLSTNDIKLIIISQLLVELSPGRDPSRFQMALETLSGRIEEATKSWLLK